jgi:hypothetical protein
MKTYEKPVLNALSLSANSLLCLSSCAIDAVEPNMNEALKTALIFKGWYTSGNVDSTVFTSDMDGTCSNIVDGYCKNTPDGNIIFNS